MAFEDNDTSTIVRRRLELNWYGINDDDESGDVHIGLYDQLPIALSGEGLVLTLDPRDHPDGFYVTDIQLPIMTNADVGYASKCVFPYWIRLETSSFVSLTEPRCLRSQPEWMVDNADKFGPLALGDLMLVAAHDAASYRQFEGNVIDNWITAAVFTQEENLELQLQFGARLLDIRIGHYPSTEEKFWLVHGVARERPLSVGIELVQDFLRSSRDVVIWDSHSFEQEWDNVTHEEYKAIIREAFGRWWVEPSAGKDWNMTMEEIWSAPGLPENEGRIVNMYESDEYFEPDLYFSNTIERWGNKDEPAELKEYLDFFTEEARTSPEYHPWRPNCQMTPTAPDIIFQKYSGLREMADVVNRNVTLWWRTDYKDLANVHTLHDYFLGTDMVQVAIDRNLQLAAGERKRKPRE